MSVCAQGLPVIHSLELFAGKKSITNGMRRLQKKAVSFELEDCSMGLQDLLDPRGWLMALSLCLRLVVGGCMWAAPVCSTWTWCSRAQTKRSPETLLGTPAGAWHIPSIADANCMCTRSELVVTMHLPKTSSCAGHYYVAFLFGHVGAVSFWSSLGQVL